MHKLILFIAIVLTPVGLLAALLALRSIISFQYPAPRKRLFIGIFTGIPLLFFLGISTFDSPRFHWNSPVWLALIPTIAWMIAQNDIPGKISNCLRATWQPTIVLSLLAYAFVLHYVTLGIPGLPYHFLNEHYFWKETAAEIEKLAEEINHQTGETPIVVGMSKWSVASAIAFYHSSSHKLDIRSRNLFGEPAAMYSFWYPSEPPTTRPILLIGMKQQALDLDQADGNIGKMLSKPGEINSRTIYRQDGVPLRTLYYRIAEGYLGSSDVAPHHLSTISK